MLITREERMLRELAGLRVELEVQKRKRTEPSRVAQRQECLRSASIPKPRQIQTAGHIDHPCASDSQMSGCPRDLAEAVDSLVCAAAAGALDEELSQRVAKEGPHI